MSVTTRTRGCARLAAGLALALASIAPGPARADDIDSLARWIDRAQADHPAVRAADSRRAAARARPDADAAFPRPKLSYGYFVEPIETRAGPQRHTLGFSQPLPVRGTRRLQRAAAELSAAAADEWIDAARWQVRTGVVSSWAGLYLLRREIELAHENLAVLGRLERVARTRYELDALGRPEVVRLQVEIGRAEDRIASLERERALRSADFRRSVGDETAAGLPWPVALPALLPLPAVDPGQTVPSLDENPRLDAGRLAAERAGALVALAERANRPTFQLDLGYVVTADPIAPGTPDAGDDAIRAGVTIQLPTQRRARQAATASAMQERDALTLSIEADRLAVAGAVDARLFRIDDATRRERLYADRLIPQITESLRASVVAFSEGTADFLDLLDAERTLLELQRSLAQARVDRVVAAAELEPLLGRAALDLPTSTSGDADAKGQP